MTQGGFYSCYHRKGTLLCVSDTETLMCHGTLAAAEQQTSTPVRQTFRCEDCIQHLCEAVS